MPVVKVKDNEPFEVAMKRFKKQVEKAGILTELRRREYFDKPSVRRKSSTFARWATSTELPEDPGSRDRARALFCERRPGGHPASGLGGTSPFCRKGVSVA